MKFIDNRKDFIKKNRIPLIIIVSILALGALISVVSYIDPNAAINEKNRNFVSRLKPMATENIETLSEPINELRTQTILPPTDESITGVQPGSNITINYTGWTANSGEIFETSFSDNRKTGITFIVGESDLEGWNEGVMGMKPGEIRRLMLPAIKAYKNDLFKPVAPGTDVVFDIELISIN